MSMALKVKIQVLFCGDHSLTVVLRQMKLGTVEDQGHA
jgi:hypothetical protein